MTTMTTTGFGLNGGPHHGAVGGTNGIIATPHPHPAGGPGAGAGAGAGGGGGCSSCSGFTPASVVMARHAAANAAASAASAANSANQLTTRKTRGLDGGLAEWAYGPRFTGIDSVRNYESSQRSHHLRAATNNEEGNGRALCIGIVYAMSPQKYQLDNPGNDVRDVSIAWSKAFGFGELLVLTDAIEDPEAYKPTANNIIESLKWLVDGAMRGQKLWLYYAGHGRNMPDRSGDESRLQDDTIVSADLVDIYDDELYDTVVKPLDNTGAQLFIANDSCRNATVFDLPHLYSVRRDRRGLIEERRPTNRAPLNCDVVAFSAARDDEEAQDSLNGGKNGAMTSAMLACQRPGITLERWVIDVQRSLDRQGIRQHVQLSSMRPLDLSSSIF